MRKKSFLVLLKNRHEKKLWSVGGGKKTGIFYFLVELTIFTELHKKTSSKGLNVFNPVA